MAGGDVASKDVSDVASNEHGDDEGAGTMNRNSVHDSQNRFGRSRTWWRYVPLPQPHDCWG